MELSRHIIAEAMEMLAEGRDLPQQLTSAPLFFVASASDETIQAMGAVDFNGVTFKIGTRKLR